MDDPQLLNFEGNPKISEEMEIWNGTKLWVIVFCEPSRSLKGIGTYFNPSVFTETSEDFIIESYLLFVSLLAFGNTV